MPDTIVQRPVFSELVATLRRQIQSGIYANRDRIPTEGELAEQFDISIRSVRSGIDALVEDGLLVRRQGSGTYVRNGRPRRQPTRTSTIATILPLAIRGYHPFFSEMLRGIREGIGDSGSDHYDYAFDAALTPGEDVGPIAWNHDTTLAALNARDDLVGIICGATVAADLREGLHAQLPIVAVDASDAVPSVAYDFQTEMEGAILRQVAAGARHIWVYGSDLQRPAFIPDSVHLELVPGVQEGRGLISAHIRHAYDAAGEAFRADPRIDGVVVGSDYEAQGVLDAAVACRLPVPERVRVTCLVNRESRLAYPFPMTVLIADGYHKGRRAVDLLQQHLAQAPCAPDRIILKCEEAYHTP